MNTIKRVKVILLLLICISNISNIVLGIGLKYTVSSSVDVTLLKTDLAIEYGYMNVDGTYNYDNYVILYSFTNPHSSTISDFNSRGEDYWEFVEDLESPAGKDLSGGSSSFESWAYIFNGPSIYNQDLYALDEIDSVSSSNSLKFYYDVVDLNIDNSTITSLTNNIISEKLAYVKKTDYSDTSYTSSYGSDYTMFSLKTEYYGKYIYRDSFTLTSGGDDVILIDKYVVPIELIDDLVDKYLDYGITENDLVSNGIRFSKILATTSSNIKSSAISYRQDMSTLSMWFTAIYGYWHPNNYGFVGGTNWTDYSYSKGTSNANLFDNILYISESIVIKESSDVYVNYCDKDGNVFATKPVTSISQTVSSSGGGSSSISTQNSGTGYHELYTLTESQTLSYEPITSFTYGGEEYNYINCKIVSAENESGVLDLLKSNITTALTNSNTPINVSSDGKIYLINLYYDNVKTDVFVNHLDTEGNILSGVEYSSLTASKNSVYSTLASAGRQYNFLESYSIGSSTTLYTKAASTPLYIGEDEYKYSYAQVGWVYSGSNTSSSVISANSNASKSTKITNSFVNITSDASSSKVYVVNYYYELVPPGQTLPDLELVGKLAFINTKNSSYDDATDGLDTDYVPSGGQLTPYIDGAYPYIVRAIDYESVTENQDSVSATVTANQKYYSKEWTYDYNCEYHPATYDDETGEKISDSYYTHSGCGYDSSYTTVKTISTTFDYTVKYNFTYYNLTNFKMYEIAYMNLYDDENLDQGGKLFSGDSTIKIGTSSSYDNRFNGGIQDSDLTIVFEDEEYYVEDTVYINTPMPDYDKGDSDSRCSSSGTVNSDSEAKEEAQAILDDETHLSASNRTTLTIYYNYYNDYVILDSKTDMLKQNEVDWSERITLKTDTVIRDLDATMFTNTSGIQSTKVDYTIKLLSYMNNIPSSDLTDYTDFDTTYLTVPSTRENGMRLLSGEIFYTLITDSKYNRGSDSFTSTDATYNLNTEVNVSSSDLKEQSRDYVGDDEVNLVTVLTPMQFADFDLITDEYVDHSTGSGNTTVLQKGAEFTITPKMQGYSKISGYSFSDTTSYVKGYYYQFDFDTIFVSVSNSDGAYLGSDSNELDSGDTIPAYTSVYIEGSESTLTAKTVEEAGSTTVQQNTNSIRIIAISENITSKLKTFFYNIGFSTYTYIDTLSVNLQSSQTRQYQINMLTRTDIYQDSYHAVSKTITTYNVGRLYDFAVTDCNDLAFKDVFRVTDSDNVNESTEVAYYSGYNKLDLTLYGFNDIVERTEEEIGTDVKTVLPLGPYKHTGMEYVGAPKMGYRISFDLKTTGYITANNYNNTRWIEIVPKFYYLSKDGTIIDDDIELYYKDSSGKYVNFIGSGYSIYYTPNDGYRYLRNTAYTDNFTTMSTKLEELVVAPTASGTPTLILDNKMMATNNTGYIQSWYGEFKLPNSTIAFSSNTGDDITVNNPYTNGYIGVIFEIYCVDEDGVTIAYGTNDKQADLTTNTSQWDYEGYLNFQTPGYAVDSSRPLYLQLEGGSLAVNNELYNQIKGTVVLFDLDNRAADDFQ